MGRVEIAEAPGFSLLGNYLSYVFFFSVFCPFIIFIPLKTTPLSLLVGLQRILCKNTRRVISIEQLNRFFNKLKEMYLNKQEVLLNSFFPPKTKFKVSNPKVFLPFFFTYEFSCYSAVLYSLSGFHYQSEEIDGS